MTQKIENRLYAVQLLTHKDFELSKPTRTDIRADGKINYFLEVESLIQTTHFETVDLIHRDRNGNIVSDAKKEHIDRQKHFTTLLEKHRDTDATLDQMLKSYQKSVKDPENELVYLYEIRDSIAQRLGSKQSATKKLGITKDEWNEIGELANNLPLKQGRHRGKAIGILGDAEIAKLARARKSATYLIEKYAEYLEMSRIHK